MAADENISSRLEYLCYYEEHSLSLLFPFTTADFTAVTFQVFLWHRTTPSTMKASSPASPRPSQPLLCIISLLHNPLHKVGLDFRQAWMLDASVSSVTSQLVERSRPNPLKESYKIYHTRNGSTSVVVKLSFSKCKNKADTTHSRVPRELAITHVTIFTQEKSTSCLDRKCI